jgi:transposase
MREPRNWKIYNQQLVDRGDATLYIDPAVLNNGTEIKTMNKGKVGRPFRYSNGLILAAFTIKCLFGLGYREAAGNLKGAVRSLGGKLYPVYTEIQDRISKLRKKDIQLNVRQLRKREKIDIAIDSTGIKEIKGGEYRTYRYGDRKGWIKLHSGTDLKTKQIVTNRITKENVHDGKEYENLTNPLKNNLNSVLLDKAYDAEKTYKHGKENHYQCIVPVRENASTKCGPNRREAVREQFGLPMGKQSHNRFFHHGEIEEWKKIQQKRWKKKVGYGRRWIVEGTFSRFKGMFGESVFSKKREMKKKELLLKIGIYNKTLPIP